MNSSFTLDTSRFRVELHISDMIIAVCYVVSPMLGNSCILVPLLLAVYPSSYLPHHAQSQRPLFGIETPELPMFLKLVPILIGYFQKSNYDNEPTWILVIFFSISYTKNHPQVRIAGLLL